MKNQVRRSGILVSMTRLFLVLLAIAALFSQFPGGSHAADASLQWDANTESDLAGYRVYYGTASKNYTSSINVGNWTSCTVSGLTAGKTYYFSATAYDTGGLESGYSGEVAYTVPGTVTPPPAATGTVAFAANAGGKQYTASGNVIYQADSRYSGGWVSTTTTTVSGTADPTLYKSTRYGNFSYRIPLANGNYNLTLKFSETYFTSKGQRIFDVLVGGKVVLSRLDIFALAGAKKAYDVTIPVSVTNGTLSIQFRSVKDYAKVNAILVTK